HHRGARQHPYPPRRPHHQWPDRRQGGGAGRGRTAQRNPLRPDERGAGAPPEEPGAGGRKVVEAGGRKAQLPHVSNAHTDGDTWVYFADANVLATGDTVNNLKRYQTNDYRKGGDVRGIIRVADAYLKVASDNTKVVVGHGPLAGKKDIEEFRAM